MKRLRLPLVLTAALVAVRTASCAPATPGAIPPVDTPAAAPSARSPAGPMPAGDLSGTHGLLAELGGRPPVEGTSVTAEFSGDATIAGSGGCNRYRAGVRTSGTTIEVDEAMATTLTACEEAVMAQESAFLAALGAARTFTLADNELTLIDAGGTTVARFTAQRQELADTGWQVAAYNDGRSAVVSVRNTAASD